MDPSVISALLGAGSSIVGTGASLLSSGNLNRRNRKWNAEQAQLNRDFQSQEAEIARQWQEDMYNQYYSPQAQIGQQMQGYKENGINPALMFGQNVGAGAMPSTSTPSGSQASGNFSLQPDFANIMAVAKDIALTRAQIDNLQSVTDKNKQDVLESSSRINLNEQQIKESSSRIDKLKEEIKHEQLKQGLTVAQELLTRGQLVSTNYENSKKQFEQSFKDKYGFYPDSSVVKTSLGILNESVRNIEYGIDKTINFVKEKYNSWFK